MGRLGSFVNFYSTLRKLSMWKSLCSHVIKWKVSTAPMQSAKLLDKQKCKLYGSKRRKSSCKTSHRRILPCPPRELQQENRLHSLHSVPAENIGNVFAWIFSNFNRRWRTHFSNDCVDTTIRRTVGWREARFSWRSQRSSFSKSTELNWLHYAD